MENIFVNDFLSEQNRELREAFIERGQEPKFRESCACLLLPCSLGEDSRACPAHSSRVLRATFREGQSQDATRGAHSYTGADPRSLDTVSENLFISLPRKLSRKRLVSLTQNKKKLLEWGPQIFKVQHLGALQRTRD